MFQTTNQTIIPSRYGTPIHDAYRERMGKASTAIPVITGIPVAIEQCHIDARDENLSKIPMRSDPCQGTWIHLMSFHYVPRCSMVLEY